MSQQPAPDKDEGFFAELRELVRTAIPVWQLIPRAQRLTLVAAMILLALGSGCNIAFPILLGHLVDRVQAVQEVNRSAILHSAMATLGWIAAMYVAREILQVIRRAFVESACTQLEQKITINAIGHLIRVDLRELSKEKIGSLEGTIRRGAYGTVHFVRLMLLECLPPLLTGIFAIVAALNKKPILALAMVGVIPMSLWLTMRQLRTQKGIRLRLIQDRSRIDGTMIELLGGLEYVRAANTEETELKRFDNTTRELRKLERRHHFEMSLFGAARALNEGFFHILVLGLGVYLAAAGQISYGDILTFSLLFLSVMSPLNEVHRSLDEGHECSLQIEELQAMLRQPRDRSYQAMPSLSPAPPWEVNRPLITSENLVVDYHTEAGPLRVLDGVSLCIRHGETIGLAGPSGCGKTTLLRILMRLAHPTAGFVRLGDRDLDGISREEISTRMGYVEQNPFIFHGTIFENITYGVAGATMEAVENAARAAGIYEEIMAMPCGFQSLVLERGSNLSGGQRQRLALARVFLKNPPLLILDECTSALDTISERHIKRSLDNSRNERTVILVAHRLSTLKDANRILVFQDGRIVEEGSYSQLLEAGGRFADLACSGETVEV